MKISLVKHPGVIGRADRYQNDPRVGIAILKLAVQLFLDGIQQGVEGQVCQRHQRGDAAELRYLQPGPGQLECEQERHGQGLQGDPQPHQLVGARTGLGPGPVERADAEADRERYQTVYGKRPGAVAADAVAALQQAQETGVRAREAIALEYARGFHFGIGGAESNVAIGVSRLGGSATWLGRVGPDAAGDLIERRLRADGEHTVVLRDPAITGLMVKYRRTGGLLHVDYHRAGSAGSRLTPADVPVALLESARVLHVTGITPALSDTARAAVFHAVETARAA